MNLMAELKMYSTLKKEKEQKVQKDWENKIMELEGQIHQMRNDISYCLELKEEAMAQGIDLLNADGHLFADDCNHQVGFFRIWFFGTARLDKSNFLSGSDEEKQLTIIGGGACPHIQLFVDRSGRVEYGYKGRYFEEDYIEYLQRFVDGFPEFKKRLEEVLEKIIMEVKNGD